MESPKFIGTNFLEDTPFINDIKESLNVVRFIPTAKELHDSNEWKENYDYYSDDSDKRVQLKYGDKFMGAYITDSKNRYGKTRVFFIIETDRDGHCYSLNEVSQYGAMISNGNVQLCSIDGDTINFHKAYHTKGKKLEEFSKENEQFGCYLIIH